MKTPFDIRDERQVLDAPIPRQRYRLPDLSTGNPGGTDPLEAYSWQDLRGIVYGDPVAATKDPNRDVGRLNGPVRT